MLNFLPVECPDCWQHRAFASPAAIGKRNEQGSPVPKFCFLARHAIMLLAVDASPGPHDDPEPRAFKLGATDLVVLRIVDRWFGQTEHYFKVQASDDNLYILRHNLVPDTWELTLFKSAGQQP